MPDARSLIIMLLVCSLGVLGPVLSAVLLNWRKRRARALKRSPLSQELLRPPGHALREQIEDMRLDGMAELAVIGMLPPVIVSIHLAQSYLLGSPETVFRTVVMVIAGAGMFVFSCNRLLKRFRQVDLLRLGLDAEMAVGQELDQLMRKGAAVFHDFPAENFNIDHVVISTQGVFAIETKGYAKPKREQGVADAQVTFDGQRLRFPTWTTEKPLEQARRQAKWLGKWLSSAIGSPVAVTPVLALPGWYVERKGRGDVWIFSGKELPKLLSQRSAQPLSEQDVQRVAHQVEQRCRNVKPNFREDKP